MSNHSPKTLENLYCWMMELIDGQDWNTYMLSAVKRLKLRFRISFCMGYDVCAE
ncbi:hypothetical protein Hanom_Chr16g01464491 [Helianthus anomalus]